MNILGISPNHDSSVCLLSDGKIKYFSKEERLTRVKRDRNPYKSILESLEIAVPDHVVWCTPTKDDSYMSSFLNRNFNTLSFKLSDLSDHHHLTHASLAFYNSGFKEAAILVVDRNGSILNNSCRESESIFKASYPNNFENIYKSYWIYDNQAHESIGLLKNLYPNCEVDIRSMYGIVKVYESATALIRQHPLDNGKVMGLSAYGDKTIPFPNLFFKDNIPNDYYFGHENQGIDLMATNQSLHSLSSSHVTPLNYKIYADYAWQVQKQTQEAMCALIQKAIDKTGCKNICITGGYGLNVVANYYYISKFPDVNFYFEPLADDSGNSIGGAMFIYRSITGDTKINPIKNTFFNGIKRDTSKIKGEKTSIKDVAKLLSTGNSVAVYRGLAEAGPRALGNRSILFDPRSKDAKDIVNKIKKREWYRPFAAVILQEDVDKYFEVGNLESSPFMTISFPAKQYAIDNIPGVIHVDNTCRLQTVEEKDGYLYKLLQEFKDITGHGVLLNTSFNLAGDPLVEFPEDALLTLNNSSLDYVWFEESNTIVKSDI